MWTDYRGTHVVLHSQNTDHTYNPRWNNAGTNHKKKRGGYLFSADGTTDWGLSNWELFPSEIRWDDGETQFLLKQQRPSIVFDDLMQPKYLVTGVDYVYDPCCDWYGFGSGWTLVQPLVTDCPAGSVLSGSSCVACSATATEYNGRCSEVTTKYGACVCTQCATGWRGDRCDIQAIICQAFEAGKQCLNMQGTATPLGADKVDSGECLATCQQEAEATGTEGCCFQYTNAPNKNCRFFPTQSQVGSVYSTYKEAALCARSR